MRHTHKIPRREWTQRESNSSQFACKAISPALVHVSPWERETESNCQPGAYETPVQPLHFPATRSRGFEPLKIGFGDQRIHHSANCVLAAILLKRYSRTASMQGVWSSLNRICWTRTNKPPVPKTGALPLGANIRGITSQISTAFSRCMIPVELTHTMSVSIDTPIVKWKWRESNPRWFLCIRFTDGDPTYCRQEPHFQMSSVGLEPTTFALKGRYSTIELRTQ